MAVAPRGPLVGRQRHLQFLEARIAEARSGLGGVVFIAGEPGIGKTSLATAAVAQARSEGCRAIWGRCREEGGAPPYWPWVQVVRGLLAADENLASAVGVASQDLQVLTEPEATQAGSRFRLYEAVGAMLRRASEDAGLVVVLDDVHQADEPSLALLRYLTAGLVDARALVLSSFRDTDVGPDHPLRRVLGAAEATSSSVLHLQGLADDETAQLVASICGVGATVVTAGIVDWPLVRLLEEAASLEGLDLAQRTALLSRMAVELYWQQGNKSAELSGEALSVAERSGDDRAVGVALHARQFTLRGPGGLAERVEIGERLVALALRLDDLDLEFEAHAWLAADVLRAGDIGRFLTELQALERVAERSREPLHRWYAQVYAAELAGLRGQQREATLIAEQAAQLGGRLEVSVAPAYRVAQLAVSARDLGTLGELEGDVRAAIQDFSYFPTLSALLALVLAETGKITEARAEIERMAPGGFAGLPPDALWTTSVALLGEAAAIAGSSHAESLAALLDPHAGEILVHGIPACWGAVDRVRGVLAAAAGRWDDADQALASALASHRRIGAPGWEARTILDEARSRRLRGDHSIARSLARSAAAQAAALRLDGLRATAEQLAAALPVAERHVPLSRREREVLALLASGASNKQIAAELVVSVHTVERHLANIYAKVGAKSRSDASAYAVRNGVA
jgi:DNA-binding CsgD family transcriptional regulator